MGLWPPLRPYLVLGEVEHLVGAAGSATPNVIPIRIQTAGRGSLITRRAVAGAEHLDLATLRLCLPLALGRGVGGKTDEQTLHGIRGRGVVHPVVRSAIAVRLGDGVVAES